MRVDTWRLYPVFALALLAGGSVWLERITRIEPPHLLAFTWEAGEAGEVTFELIDEAGATRLILTHTGLRGRDDAVNFGGGWHAHLGVLERRITGAPVANFWVLHDRAESFMREQLGMPKVQ